MLLAVQLPYPLMFFRPKYAMFSLVFVVVLDTLNVDGTLYFRLTSIACSLRTTTWSVMW
jgi:hypothetical protein